MHISHAFLFVLFAIQSVFSEDSKNIGCFKLPQKPVVCSLGNTDTERQHSRNITNAVANALQWMRQQHNKFDVPALAWNVASLRLTGYVNDGRRCTDTLAHRIQRFDDLTQDDVTGLSGGKLALFMLGLKSSCNNARMYKGLNLLDILKTKMKSFPKGEFNHFYQYSLGIIALYVHGSDIPSAFGEKLLRGVLLGRKKKSTLNPNHMTDTEALAVIAVSALNQQKFVAHWVRKHIEKEKRKAARKIKRILSKGNYENIVTMAHMLQALQVVVVSMSTKPYCADIYNWFLKQQDKAGSFGVVMVTATVLPVLSGRSILELKNLDCPMKKDIVDDSMMKKWIHESRLQTENQKKKKTRRQRKNISVSMKVVFDIDGLQDQDTIMELSVQSGTTVLDILAVAAGHNNCFKHETKDSSWGKYVIKLCDVESNNIKGAYWVYYVNGKYATEGAGKYHVQDNDVITWKYKSLSK